MFMEKQNFGIDSIPSNDNEEFIQTAQSNNMMNFSIINNEFNIFYKDIIIKDDLAIIHDKFTIIFYNITEPENPTILSESSRFKNEIVKIDKIFEESSITKMKTSEFKPTEIRESPYKKLNQE